MKEESKDKVSRSERMHEALNIMQSGMSKTDANKYSMSPLLRWVADHVQMAYQAGRDDLSNKPTKDAAEQYAKHKGFII